MRRTGKVSLTPQKKDDSGSSQPSELEESGVKKLYDMQFVSKMVIEVEAGLAPSVGAR